MKSFSKVAVFSAASATTAWLTSIAFATGAMPTLYAQQASSAQVAAATPATPQMSDKVFKNVQVLKGITVDEFMGTMGVFTTSLSLCCGNCHTGAGTSNPKWEDDPPRKTDGARHDLDGAEHQQDQLRRAPGRDVLDVPPRAAESVGHAAARLRVRRGRRQPAGHSRPRSERHRKPSIRSSTSSSRREGGAAPTERAHELFGQRQEPAVRRSRRRQPGRSVREGRRPLRIVRAPAGRRRGARLRRHERMVAASADRDAAIPADGDPARRTQVRRGDGVPVEDPYVLHQLAGELRSDD